MAEPTVTTTAPIHDLDKDVAEYFEFVVEGYHYKFRQMNTEEMEKLKDVQDDDKKSKEYLFTFITPVDPSSPAFPDLAKKIIAPKWAKFREMMQVEFSG